MKAFFVTIGSRGDVQPYVALGQALAKKGHAVMVCAPSNFETFVTDAGLQYGYMTDELIKLIDTDMGREALEDTNGVFGAVKTSLKMMRLTKPLNEKMMRDTWNAAEAFNPDVVIYNSKALAAMHIAEKLSIPAVMAILQPMIVPTEAFPAIGLPALNWGVVYNKSSYKVIEMGYNAYAKIVDKFRIDVLGLEAFPKKTGVLHTANGTPIHVLHGFSEQLVPRPADWHEEAHINGFWFMEEENGWEAPEDLVDFINAGDPPIYIGFGSMAGRSPEKKAKMVIEALQKAGLRGIIATGWGGLDVGEVPDTIYKLEKAPHNWLFPQMKAVVHHGGAGTTAAGLYAGKPTLICPFFGDQPFWGRKAHEMGIGPKPIPQKRMTVERLTEAFLQLKNDQLMAEKAAAIGAKIRAENGVGDTIQLIEDLVK